jgi:hypothetical protein
MYKDQKVKSVIHCFTQFCVMNYNSNNNVSIISLKFDHMLLMSKYLKELS